MLSLNGLSDRLRGLYFIIFYHLYFLDFYVFFKRERNKIYHDKRVKTEWRSLLSSMHTLRFCFSAIWSPASPLIRKSECVKQTVTVRAYTKESEALQIYSKLPLPPSFTPLYNTGVPEGPVLSRPPKCPQHLAHQGTGSFFFF